MKKFILFAVVMTTLIQAQGNSSVLKSIGVDLKLSIIQQAKVENSITADNISVSTDLNSLSGVFALNYYYNERYAFTFTTGVISANTNANVSWGNVSTDASTVVPILIGMKFYFIDLFDEAPFKPYFAASAGFFMGFETKTEILSTSVSNQTAIAGHLGAGIDLFISDFFKLNMEAGFNLAGEFDKPIAGKKNYSSGEFALGIGFIF